MFLQYLLGCLEVRCLLDGKNLGNFNGVTNEYKSKVCVHVSVVGAINALKKHICSGNVSNFESIVEKGLFSRKDKVRTGPRSRNYINNNLEMMGYHKVGIYDN